MPALSGPSPGDSSGGAKNQKGGPHFKNAVLDVCSSQRAKREMGGHIFQMGGLDTTGPPAGDVPGRCTIRRTRRLHKALGQRGHQKELKIITT